MQPLFVTRGGSDQDPKNLKKLKDLIKKQKDVIKLAKESKISIIFIEYENFGVTNSELKKSIGNYKDVKYMLKDSDGIFEQYNSHKDKITDYLISKDIGNLIIVGANGGACVELSIEGSLSNKCNIIAYNPGIADFNYRDFIYPYTYDHSISSSCDTCKFKQVSQLEVISLELASKKKAAKTEDTKEINDSKRGSNEKHSVFSETSESRKIIRTKAK